MGNDKQDGGKAPAKVETVNIKVFIHCEGCRKKVWKLLKSIDGVHNVEVDAALGKVIVTGTVDSKLLLKKIEKSGKFAELWSEGEGKKGHQKEEKKEASKEKNEGKFEEKKVKGDGSEIADGEDGDNEDANANANGEGGKKKKKKGGGGGGSADGGGGFDQDGSSKNIANKSVSPIMIERGYSLASAEYATRMFSDENANNCSMM